MVAIRLMDPGDVQQVAPARDPGQRRASPEDFGSQIGAALEQAGRVIGALGAHAQDLQDRQQRQTDALGNERWRIMRNQELSNSLTNAQQGAQPGAPNFYNDLQKQWTADSQAKLDAFQKQYGISKDGMKRLQLTDLELQGEYGGRAVAWANNEGVRFKAQTATDNINSVLDSAAAHGGFADAQKTIAANVAAAGNVFTPEQRAKLDESVKKDTLQAFTTWAKGTAEQGFTDQNDLNAKMGKFEAELKSLPLDAGEKDLLRSKFKADFGEAYFKQHPTEVPKPNAQGGGGGGNYASRVAQIESGNNPMAYNKGSGAAGLYQFVPSTAQRYGLPTDARQASVQQQTDAFNRLTADNARALQHALGRTPTDGELYLAHQQGAGGAAALLKNPNASAASILGAGAVLSNGGTANMTAGEFAKMWIDKYNGTKGGAAQPNNQPGSVNDWYNSMTVDQRMAADRNASEAYRTNIGNTVPDVLAAYERTGSYSGSEPTQSDYIAGYGVQEGQQRYQAFEQAKETAQQVHAFTDMAGQDILAQVNAARDAIPSGSGAALAEKNYTTLQEAATHVFAAREKPGDYVVQNFPDVKAAWAAYDPNNQDTAKQAIALSVAKQQQLGVEPSKIQPLPTPIVEAAATAFKDETKPIETRADAVTGLVLMTPDPDQQRSIFNELVKAGVPSSAEAAVEAAARGDQPAARRLYAAAVSDPQKYPLAGDKTTLEQTRKDISDGINSKLIASGSVGESYYGLQYGEPANYERARRDTELMESAVRINMSQNGGNVKDAVDRATKDLFGDTVRVNQVLPSGSSIDLLLSGDKAAALGGFMSHLPGLQYALGGESPLIAGFDKMVPGVRAALQMQADKALQPLNAAQRLVPDAAIKRHIDEVINTGAFRSYGYGDSQLVGFYDATTNTFVAKSDGTPLLFDIRNVMKAGMPTPHHRHSEPPAPMPTSPDMSQPPSQPGSINSLVQ